MESKIADFAEHANLWMSVPEIVAEHVRSSAEGRGHAFDIEDKTLPFAVFKPETEWNLNCSVGTALHN